MIIALQIIGGLILLIAGGEVVVKGAVALARKMNISTVVVGLTVVAYGTSAPEAVISINAALQDHSDIAIGNVVGSNIANILLVVGTTALLWPVAVHRTLARRDGTVMVVAALLLAVLAANGEINRFDAAVFFLLAAVYTLFTIYDARQGESDQALVKELEEEAKENPQMATYLALAMLLAGFGLLVIGSDILIEGAVTLAANYGLSEAVIGATIVAVGGSSPELVTSLMAAWRKHADIGLANIVGSNIFNILGVFGMAGLAAPMTVAEQFLSFDIWLMIAVTLVFFLLLLMGKNIGRLMGACFTAAYAGYIFWQYAILT